MATGALLATGLKALTARTEDVVMTRNMVGLRMSSVDDCRCGNRYGEVKNRACEWRKEKRREERKKEV